MARWEDDTEEADDKTEDLWDKLFEEANDAWEHSEAEWRDRADDDDQADDGDAWEQAGAGREERDINFGGWHNAAQSPTPETGDYQYVIYHGEDEEKRGRIWYVEEGGWNISQVILAANGDVDSSEVVGVAYEEYSG